MTASSKSEIRNPKSEIGKVSILLPNLNNAKFLEERFTSIVNQTYQNFEVIVCDSYSEDGAIDIIRNWAARDQRIVLHLVPKEGLYAGWNECIRRARGDYCYIATSDDTMSPNCLEIMVAALEKHKDSAVAMCGLDLTDENGTSLPADKNWRSSPFPCYLGSQIDLAHKRKAPLDGILSMYLHNIWCSATQLLVRKRLYDQYGLYRTDLGSGADVEWNLRISMFENIVYIPDILATLRIHPKSATQLRNVSVNEDINIKISILKMALERCQERDTQLANQLLQANLLDPYYFQSWFYQIQKTPINTLYQLSLFILKGGKKRMQLFSLCSLTMLLNGKAGLQKALTDRLLQKLRIDLKDFISNI